MAVEVKVLGLPELKAALAAIPGKLRKRALRNALAAAGRVVRDEARHAAPVLSMGLRAPYRMPGTLKKAINVRTSKIARRSGDVGVFVNVRPAKASQRGAKSRTDPFYWRWLNFGWTPASGPRTTVSKRERRRAQRSGAPAIAGRHFLERGARKLGQALEVFKAKIGPAIAKLNNKGQTP